MAALLHVKVEHAHTVDDMLSKLMGDLVEPRRGFIQSPSILAERSQRLQVGAGLLSG